MNSIINSAAKFVAGIATTLYQGFIATFLWTWFVFPIWGIETPSFILLAGLFIFSRMFIHLTMSDFDLISKKMESKENKQFINLASWVSLLYNFILATGCFFAGWLFHFFA